MFDEHQYPDVLIRADPDDLEHKRREKMDDPWGTECYWTVKGTPRKTGRGGAILFHDGDKVWGLAIITRVETGRIWFEPIRESPWDFDVPEPPTRGYQYVDKAGAES